VKIKLISLITLSVLPLFIAQQPVGLSDIIRNSALTLSRPLLQVSQFASTHLTHSIEQVQQHLHLWEDNQALKQEVSELKAQVEELSHNERENIRLKKLLVLRQKLAKLVTMSNVLSRDITSWRDWLVLDKGKKNAVTKNMAVMTLEGLVGRVLSAAGHSSRVMLITDVQSRVGVRVRETRDTGIVMGKGGPILTLKYIDRYAEIEEGQFVETSGLGGLYPSGLLVGRITKVWMEKDGLYKAASVQPTANFSKLEEVAIVRSKKQ